MNLILSSSFLILFKCHRTVLPLNIKTILYYKSKNHSIIQLSKCFILKYLADVCERFFGLLANEVITNEFGIWQSTDILHYFEGVRLKQRGMKED